MKIFTLGTSNRSLKEFLEILNFYKIKRIIDVRHFPTSKLFPHFKKENLERFLRENKIEYFHLEKLGGYRKGGYENYMETEDFKEGLENLIEFAKKKKTAIICAEKFPWKCHRAFISRKLEEKSFEIIHIIEKNRIWSPKREPKEIKPVCQKAKFLKSRD
jgi:uncharacterized protein (DUF488 family)